MSQITCPFCERQNEGNPSDHYHRHECHRRDVLRRIEIEGRTPALLAELDRASDTGD